MPQQKLIIVQLENEEKNPTIYGQLVLPFFTEARIGKKKTCERQVKKCKDVKYYNSFPTFAILPFLNIVLPTQNHCQRQQISIIIKLD